LSSESDASITQPQPFNYSALATHTKCISPPSPHHCSSQPSLQPRKSSADKKTRSVLPTTPFPHVARARRPNSHTQIVRSVSHYYLHSHAIPYHLITPSRRQEREREREREREGKARQTKPQGKEALLLIRSFPYNLRYRSSAHQRLRDELRARRRVSEVLYRAGCKFAVCMDFCLCLSSFFYCSQLLASFTCRQDTVG
jgi:hypothetical protein